MADKPKDHVEESGAGENLIACEVCLKEIPESHAKTAEADDYVAHFCGLDCYQKWKTQHKHEAK